MSNRNNDVFRVLPVSNETLKEAGAAVETLAPGQLGVFNADTQLTIDETANPMPKNIFFAVGIDRDGDGAAATDDFRFSAGQFIQKSGVLGFTTQDYNAGSPMTVSIGNYRAKADTEYGIRVEFRNSKISRIQGYNQFSKAYMVTTPCADDCVVGCDSLDANALTLQLVDVINADEAGLLKAEAIARQDLLQAIHGTLASYPPGGVMTAADVEALITFNETALDADKVFTDIKLTSQPLKIGSYCQINLHYHKLLETTLIVSLIEGFNCSGAVTTNTYPVFAQGTGVNIQQKEYHASGNSGSGPYKLSPVTGMAIGNIEYLSDKATNYDQVILENNFESDSGWKEYSNAVSTVFALPTGVGTVKAKLIAFLTAFAQ
jgi:hypothetical protein